MGAQLTLAWYRGIAGDGSGLSDFLGLRYGFHEFETRDARAMSALRFSGWILVLAGVGLALRDAAAPWLDHSRFHPISCGAVVAWSRIWPLALSIDRLFLRYVFDPLAGFIAVLWAFAVLLGLGIALLAIDSRNGRGHRRR